MSDIFNAVVATALVDNDIGRKSLQNIVGDDNTFGQYSKTLYGLPGFYENEAPSDAPSDFCGNCSKKGTSASWCSVCNHDHQVANNIMKKRLADLRKTILSEIKANPKYIPKHVLRNDMLLTSDLNEVLSNKDIFIWLPHKLDPGCTLENLKCWATGCSGGKITMKGLNWRGVEGLNDNGFVMYAEFRCSGCKGDKSSLQTDVLEHMGFPLVVIDKCPVVSLHRSTLDRTLYDLYLSTVGTIVGPGQFASIVEKRRSARWAEDCATYLQVTLAEKSAKMRGIGQYGFCEDSPTETKSFPQRDTHCDGYGGSKGPTEKHHVGL